MDPFHISPDPISPYRRPSSAGHTLGHSDSPYAKPLESPQPQLGKEPWACSGVTSRRVFRPGNPKSQQAGHSCLSTSSALLAHPPSSVIRAHYRIIPSLSPPKFLAPTLHYIFSSFSSFRSSLLPSPFNQTSPRAFPFWCSGVHDSDYHGLSVNEYPTPTIYADRLATSTNITCTKAQSLIIYVFTCS
ncbi:hypothetical protein FZEAL_10006 [Fusarium zealandicum]|uniref:Uncharacterized protein n=1 Tax=Fusarium zealandicum TaxID=1053134 RepID=A0A8H4U660_9HYPO|nr:hypothetical protein FZEAL_10006 [Fusarium zealandicum]